MILNRAEIFVYHFIKSFFKKHIEPGRGKLVLVHPVTTLNVITFSSHLFLGRESKESFHVKVRGKGFSKCTIFGSMSLYLIQVNYIYLIRMFSFVLFRSDHNILRFDIIMVVSMIFKLIVSLMDLFPDLKFTIKIVT